MICIYEEARLFYMDTYQINNWVVIIFQYFKCVNWSHNLPIYQISQFTPYVRHVVKVYFSPLKAALKFKNKF